MSSVAGGCGRVRGVTHRMRRPLIAVAAVGLVAGCSGGDPSTAATVGHTTIGVDEVQSESRWIAQNSPETRKLVQERPSRMASVSRAALAQDIRHLLIADVARREHLTPDTAKVDQLVEQAGGTDNAAKALGVVPAKLRSYATDAALLNQLAAKRMGTVKVHLVGGMFSAQPPGSRAKAADMANKIAAHPDQAKQLAASAQAPVDQTSTMGDIPELLATPVYTAAKGSVVVAQTTMQQTPVWLVTLIDERTTVRPKKPPTLDEQTVAAAGPQLLGPAAERAGVQVNPRFGKWDAASAEVVGSPSDAPAQVLPPRTP